MRQNIIDALVGIGYKKTNVGNASRSVRFHVHGDHNAKFRNYTYTDGWISIQKDYRDPSGSTYTIMVVRNHIAETSRGSLTVVHSQKNYSQKITLQSNMEDTLSLICETVQSLMNDSIKEIELVSAVDYVKVTYDGKKENSDEKNKEG